MVASILCNFVVIAADVKVGFVSVAMVLEKAPQSEAARIALEEEFSPREKKLIAAQKQLRALETTYSREADIMSASKRKDIERQVRDKKREIKRAREEFQEDLNIRRNEELAKLQQVVLKAIRKIAKEAHYDFVLNDSSVLYHSDRVNITDRVVKHLNNGKRSRRSKKN